jgi:ATP-dependent RNA helicase DDX19/DBP5
MPLTKNQTGNLVPAMDTYLHRIGRTGRFGTKGIGLTLVEEKYIGNIKEIENFYTSTIEEIKSMDDLIAEFKKLLNEY